MSITISERELEALVERKVNRAMQESVVSRASSVLDVARYYQLEPVKLNKKELAKLNKARQNFKKGNYFTLAQVRNELGISN